MDIDVQSNRLTQSRRNTYSSPSGQPAVPYALSPTQTLPTLVSGASHMRPESMGGLPAMAPTSPTSHTVPEALKLEEHVGAGPVKDTERATPSTFKIIPPPSGDPQSTPTAPQDLAPAPPPPPPPPPPLLPPPPHGPLPLDMYFTIDGTQITRLNKNAEKIYHRFVNDLGGFVRIQEEITRLRLQVQEHRIALQRYRKNVSDCDRVFWDELRKSWAEGLDFDDPKLVELYESSQAARDKVGPTEDDYEKMELKLGSEEYSLTRKFEDLQRSYQHFFKLQMGSSTRAPGSEISYINSVGADEEREPRNISKLHGANLGDGVKVGGLPTRGVISPVPAQQEDNAPVDSSLSASKSPVLDRRNSTIITAEDRAKMYAEDDNFLLESTFGESRSPKIWTEPQAMADNLRGIGLRPIPEGRESDDSPADVFEDSKSLLLLGDDIDTRSTLSDYLLEFDSTTTRVNRWLLHKLRVSPWEVFELRREVTASSGIVPSWAQLALQLWEQDLDEIGSDYRETSSEGGSLDQLVPSATPPYPRPGNSRKRRKRDSRSLHSIPIRPLTKHDLDDTVMKFRVRDASVTNSAPPESLENFPQ
ncbi:uncharacterized protein K441DRAFT_167289 [Cenococcum geophilum 1.58]|uniref:uncharacterized protein n=1 Tax=Cenococcum geophilum 1.58 TaxID=794803 RepID=UPI00358FBEE5|nr:hypothetical protein K441DRAFT_167289 [Cenococcum geophilum 1.58]